MARSVKGVDQRDSRDLGKYRREDWDGVTMMACCNCMGRLKGGCTFHVRDLVRRAMG